MTDLVDARWGTAETPLPDWRKETDDTFDDDEELEKTPADVIEMLGFDPLEEDDFDGAADEFNEADHPRGQPENAGQFGPGGGSSKTTSTLTKTASTKPYRAGLKAHGMEWASERKSLWRSVAPDDIEELIKNSPKNQSALAEVCNGVSESAGVKFKNPGVKSEEGIRGKVAGGKTVQQVNDAVRGGFDTPTPESSEKVVRALAKKFEVVDEGWTITPQGYFDRKVMVRFEDGQIGEVQMWAPGMLDAKEGSGEGHKMYKAWGNSKDPAERFELNEKMNALYKSVQDRLDPTWHSIFRPNKK